MTSQELTEAREALGLKRIDLARLFETTDRTVRAWENDVDTKWRPIPFAVATLIRLAVKYPTVRRELGIKAKRKSKQAAAG
jgi:DNA-binding transcriptional regulator YiaG